MKKLIVFVLLITVTAAYLFFTIKNRVRSDFHQSIIQPTLTQSPSVTVYLQKNASITTTLFIPYWTITNSSAIGNYNSYVYFGLVPGSNGIDLAENGAEDLKLFLSVVPQNGNKLLTLRMVDTDQNLSILKNQTLEQQIISGTVGLAKKNQFSGIVMDLEISAIPFNTLEEQIDSFNELFYKTAKQSNLNFYQTVYGDTFYRLRPFDMKTMAKYSDGILVMAYDFSKANGNPGPNFPLFGKVTYGYDMTQMSQDFLQFVPDSKLTVVFGLFGYDWPVDNAGNAISQGQPLTDQQIQKKFLSGCSFNPCVIKKDSLSSETQIRYTDNNNQKHIVWFEDMNSLTAKEQFLKKQGVNSFGLWAYSYF
jgi:spore germination protein YaaH